MAKGKMDLWAFVGKLLQRHDGDTLREGIRVLAQALMESGVSGLIGAERYDRSGGRRVVTGLPAGNGSPEGAVEQGDDADEARGGTRMVS